MNKIKLCLHIKNTLICSFDFIERSWVVQEISVVCKCQAIFSSHCSLGEVIQKIIQPQKAINSKYQFVNVNGKPGVNSTNLVTKLAFNMLEPITDHTRHQIFN